MLSMVNRLLEPHLSEVEQRFSVTLVAQIYKGCVARFLQQIRCELVVLRCIEEAHVFHECEQGNYLTSKKRVFDYFSQVFILDSQAGFRHRRAMHKHLTKRI